MSETTVKKKKSSIDMTKGPIAGPMIRFILPLIGSSIFQQLYNTVDFLYVGNVLTKTSAAAVGASSTLISMTIGLFSGISVGTSVVAAQAIGAHDTEKGEKVIHTSVKFGIIGGLTVMLLLELLAEDRKTDKSAYKNYKNDDGDDPAYRKTAFFNFFSFGYHRIRK